MTDGCIQHLIGPLPGESAASIADGTMGVSRSGGDWSSLPADEVPLACGTVSCCLKTLLEHLPSGLLTLEDLGWDHTSCGYMRPGMSAEAFEAFMARINTGEGRAASVRQPAWVAEGRSKSLVCSVCEYLAWHDFAKRAVFCNHQLPFVTACHVHGTVLSLRHPGAEPGYRPRSIADPRAVDFAASSANIRLGGRNLHDMRQRFCNELATTGYMRGNGSLRVTEFGKDLAAFSADNIISSCLRKLMSSPLRSRQIARWLDAKAVINPAFLASLDMFLRHVLGEGNGN